LFCLAFGRSPFESPKEGVQKLAILNGRYTVPAGRRIRSTVFSEGYVALIQKLLAANPSNRPFIAEVIPLLEAQMK
jgi:hypothetical protein